MSFASVLTDEAAPTYSRLRAKEANGPNILSKTSEAHGLQEKGLPMSLGIFGEEATKSSCYVPFQRAGDPPYDKTTSFGIVKWDCLYVICLVLSLYFVPTERLWIGFGLFLMLCCAGPIGVFIRRTSSVRRYQAVSVYLFGACFGIGTTLRRTGWEPGTGYLSDVIVPLFILGFAAFAVLALNELRKRQK